MDDTNIALALIEPSMADALAAIEVAEDLSDDKRRHWMCSLRIVAKALGKPPQLVPARWTAVRIPISRLHHAQMDVTAKTLVNHRGNVRAALNWFAEEENVLCVPKTSSAFDRLKESPNVRARCLHCSASFWPSWPRHSSRGDGLKQRMRHSGIS